MRNILEIKFTGQGALCEQKEKRRMTGSGSWEKLDLNFEGNQGDDV